MKFHKQLKVPGLNEEQIIEGLKSTGMTMRTMRQEYFGQRKFKPTNTCLLYTSPSPRDS